MNDQILGFSFVFECFSDVFWETENVFIDGMCPNFFGMTSKNVKLKLIIVAKTICLLSIDLLNRQQTNTIFNEISRVISPDKGKEAVLKGQFYVFVTFVIKMLSIKYELK